MFPAPFSTSSPKTSTRNRLTRLTLAVGLSFGLIASLSACDRGPSDLERMQNSGSASQTQPVSLQAVNETISQDAKGNQAVRVKLTTSKGDILLELDSQRAPNTVANFVEYVDAGHYNGLIFHRVIENFMIQGGGFDGSYSKRKTRTPIKNEADNGLKNDNGTIAMARTGDPHSASAQFFINTKDNGFLNHSSKSPRGWGYAVFGRVIEGMNVVEKINTVRTGSGGQFRTDVPSEPIVIKSAVVIR